MAAFDKYQTNIIIPILAKRMVWEACSCLFIPKRFQVWNKTHIFPKHKSLQKNYLKCSRPYTQHKTVSAWCQVREGDPWRPG